MRRALAVLGAIALAAPAIAMPARAAETGVPFPVFDLDGYCRAQAHYSYAATLGDSSFDGVLATCRDRESDAKAGAAAVWPRVTTKVATECAALADGKYSWLARCLDASAATLSRR